MADRLEVFDRLGSTNDEAMARFRAGDPGGLWIMAREQGSGRGRQGRVWSSPPGNLYASYLCVDPCPPAVAPQIGFVAGVSLHQAVSGLTGLPADRLALKWPNDLLLDGAKLSGILVEGSREPDGRQAVVIGCGVNLRHHPSDTPYRATSLAAHGLAVDPDTAVVALAAALAENLRLWAGGRRFDTIRARWLERAGGIGGPVTVRRPGGDRAGIFVDLDADGALLLDEGRGPVRIDAGDVFLGDAPTPLPASPGPAQS